MLKLRLLLVLIFIIILTTILTSKSINQKVNQWEKSNTSYVRKLLSKNIAITLEPDNSNLYLDRGNIYRKKKKYDKAISDFNKAIRDYLIKDAQELLKEEALQPLLSTQE
jgi:tetratricopeptide (TPR) repeat protein